MRLFKVSLLMLGVVLALWGGSYGYNQLRDGFSIHAITSSLPLSPHLEKQASAEKKAWLQVKLDQPYHYVAKGSQFYIFESADGKWVLKFFKHKHLRPLSWLRKIPLPQKYKPRVEELIARREKRIGQLLSSCQLAYDKLAEETGLLFIHLHHHCPSLEKEILLIDKLQRRHKISIDNYEYIFQKKAISFREKFSHIKEQSEMQECLQQLVDLLLKRCHKAIRDGDAAFAQNIGFSSEEKCAFFLDIGQFYEDPSLLEPQEQRADITKRLHELALQLQRYCPELDKNNFITFY